MAYQRWWKTVRDQQGNAVNGANCAVYNGGTGTLATVYDPNTDDSAPGGLSNPFVTTASGVFGFMAADGEYDVQISGGNGATQQYRVTLNGFVSGSAASLAADLAANTGSELVGYGAGTVKDALDAAALIPAAFQSADAVVTAAFESADAALDTRLDAVEIGQSSAVVGYDTQANLYANLVPIANSVAYVTNDSTPANNGTYRKSGASGSGSWVQSSYDRVALLETATAPPVGAVEVIGGGKNKFNPALATNGKIRDFAGGGLSTYADGMDFGAHIVEEGRTYTLWMPVAEVGYNANNRLYCFTSGGVYLGLNAALSAYPVAPTPPTGVVWSDYINGAYHTVTFTIPVGSGIGKVATMAAYSTHTLADFNRVVAAMQLEESTGKTIFEASGYTGAPTLKTAAAPMQLLSATLPARGSRVVVVKSGDIIYIRTAWNSTLDLVQAVTLSTGVKYENAAINPQRAATIPAATSDLNIITAFAVGTTLAVMGDDAAPAFYNDTYIGGNHGPAFGHQVTKSAHGKTSADVGSTWSALGHTYTLLRVIDTDKILLMSENTGTASRWGFDLTTLAGVALIHISGATNTASFTPTADTPATQVTPSTNNHTKAVRLNGKVPVALDGFYTCDFLDMVDTYTIMNPVAMLTYLQSHIGSTSINPDAIAGDARVSVTYRYGSNGACSVFQRFQALSDVHLGFVGFVQAGVVSYPSKTLLQYVPGLNPIVGGLKTWNFTATEDITGAVESINLVNTSWADANNPPDRMAQIVKNGGTNEFGHAIGYGLQRGSSQASIRKSATSQAGLFYNSRKQYPKLVDTYNSAFTAGNMPAGTVVEAVTYRSLYSSDTLPQATVFTWYFDGQDRVVVLDFHQSVSFLKIPTPPDWVGKDAAVVSATAGFTLHSSIVTEDGLLISVSGGYGSASIRVR